MKKSKAFTLIELMIVIAVIAVLAALLLPSLQKARALAKGIGCLSNLKQSYVPCQLYASDYGGYLIMVDTISWGTWSSWIYNAGYFKSHYKALMCAEAELNSAQAGNTVGNIVKTYAFSSNYACHYKNGTEAASFQVSNYQGLFLFKLKSPSEFVFLLDGKMSGYKCNLSKVDSGSISSAYSWSATPWTIHRKDAAVNAVYGDGHCVADSKAGLRGNFSSSLEFIYEPTFSW